MPITSQPTVARPAMARGRLVRAGPRSYIRREPAAGLLQGRVAGLDSLGREFDFLNLSRSAEVISRPGDCVSDFSEARHGPTQAQWVAAAPSASAVEGNP